MQSNIYADILFRLVRIAIGTEEATAPFDVKGVEWAKVYALARKQGVLALAFDGLMQIFEVDREFAKSFPLPQKLQWINAVFRIEQRYNVSREVCADLADKWAEQGVKTLCLKGMAFSTYYPEPSHRECGDFDPGQPDMKHLPLLRRWKNRVGLKSAFGKFRRYLDDFEFVNVAEADEQIDWSAAKHIEL